MSLLTEPERPPGRGEGERTHRCLRELRARIDAVNDEILRALEKRGDLVLQVMHLKVELGKPLLDPARERAMLERLGARANGPFSRADVRRVFRAVIAVSRGLAARFSQSD